MPIYLDHNATTPVDPTVLDAMLPFLRNEPGNASSIHSYGQRARSAVETAREQLAQLLNARPQEIIFTSGGTESDNHAIFGITRASTHATKHIITTNIEHEAVLNACQHLESSANENTTVTYIPVDTNGVVDPTKIRAAIRPDTVLITVMHANNEIGSIQPLAEISKIAAENKIPFHTDAVQSVGKIPVNVATLGVDLLSLSGHKLYAPKGIGALFIKSNTRLQQFLYGGHHQRGARPGTENVPGIVALGQAAELARLNLEKDSAQIAQLRDQLESALLTQIENSFINAAAAPRTPNTTNITFPNIDGEALLIALDLRGLAVSTGSACSSGAVEPSHVLTAIGLSPTDARSTIRLSLGRHTTPQEITTALAVIPPAVARLRALSPSSAAKR
jgi:cysteine desulfurase